MENYIEIDLNELITKDIREKITNFEETISRLQKCTREQASSIKNLELELYEKNSLYKNSLFLIEALRDSWQSLQVSSYENKRVAIDQIRYAFLRDAMNLLFGVKEEFNGYLGRGYLWKHLAINFYHNKENLKTLLLITGQDIPIDLIDSFRMPEDFTRDEILTYVKNPHYCTNGENYGLSIYYMESSKGNVPHDLLQANKYILDDEVFKEIITTLNTHRGDYLYLYTIPQYANISDEMISIMGTTLLNQDSLLVDSIKHFICENMLKFNKETLDFLYRKISSNNQFRLFYWLNFPVEYQQKYLKEKSLNRVLELLNKCNWTLEEKELFLKDYLSK